MDLNLTGKRAVVTGSTAGIGFAIAAGLAQQNAEVVINGRERSRVDAAIEKLREQIPQGAFVPAAADVGTAEGCDTLIRAVPEADILVNNTGIFEPKAFEEIPDEDWERLFRVNVMSGIRLTRHYLPGMKSRNWGRIVFISSESAVQIPVEMIHYGMTKTAQLAIARGVAETLSGTGVTCNSVLPGPTRSEGVERFVEDLARHRNVSQEQVEHEFFQTARPTSLLQRFARVDEVANMVCYVCSPAATATNGASLRVDGGVVRSIV